MSEEAPENGSGIAVSIPVAVAERHLSVVRALLRRDFLASGGYRESLVEVASAACASVGGRRAFVALKSASGEWGGYLDDGTALDETILRLVGSMTLIEKVVSEGQAILTSVSQPLLTRSKSIDRNDIQNVLVVPIRAWRREGDETVVDRVGCLHVDRAGADPSFEQPDIDIVLDLANLLERTLGILRQLTVAEKELTRTRRRLEATLVVEQEAYRLHHVQSRDADYIKTVLEPLKRAARGGRLGILLVGPTGAGKTHLAQSFHFESCRREGPFVVLDCGQVSSSEALGAELFGFAPHSGFSVPKEGRPGKAALADGGTLFVDEVATLPLDLQQRLLRLIEKGRFTKLGGTEEIEVDVQVVAAANSDLVQLVRQGRFREDLYWRLSEVAVRVPPLDEHRGDIPVLADLFLVRARERFGRQDLRSLEPDALERLVEFPWSRAGNTRGLEHTLNRSALMAPDDSPVLTADDLVLPELLAPPDGDVGTSVADAPRPPLTPRPATRGALRDLLVQLLDEHRGVIARVAEDPRLAPAFGLRTGPVPASTVRLRIRRLGLDEDLYGARQKAELQLEDVIEAVRSHGGGGAAARALGITRDAVVWRLRQAGLTVTQVLGVADEERLT